MNMPVEVFGHVGVNGVRVQLLVGQECSIGHVSALLRIIHLVMHQIALVLTQCSSRATRLHV